VAALPHAVGERAAFRKRLAQPEQDGKPRGGNVGGHAGEIGPRADFIELFGAI
jgi:hypothetical protein